MRAQLRQREEPDQYSPTLNVDAIVVVVAVYLTRSLLKLLLNIL